MAKYQQKSVVGDAVLRDGASSTANAFIGETYGGAPTDSERVIHTIMDAMSIVSGRSPSDRETALRILRRAIDIADNTGVTHDTMRQLRNMETDLGD